MPSGTESCCRTSCSRGRAGYRYQNSDLRTLRAIVSGNQTRLWFCSVPQALISRTKDFEDTYQLMGSNLVVFRERLLTVNILQPDILAKKSQLDQLLVSHMTSFTIK